MVSPQLALQYSDGHEQAVMGDEAMKEACGVFGVFAPGRDVARLCFDGLYALQHRGQESAGMAVSDQDTITVVKDMGLVASVFDDRTLSCLPGDLAVGHTRYSTAGPSTWHSAQPVYRPAGRAGFALAHNGNLTNTDVLASKAGMLPGIVTNDSDIVAELMASYYPPERPDCLDGTKPESLENALVSTLALLEGAFSFVLMDVDHVYGARDPNGFRPLCLGRLDPGEEDGSRGCGWILASETAALDVVGAQFVREIDPGEVVVIDADGVRSLHPFAPGQVNPKLCLFEFVYFARPDSWIYGREVHMARCRMGEYLATQSPADADMVIGVPDSGISAAEGYARRSGIAYGQGLVKNRYIGRTFIAPTQRDRDRGVRRKLNPLRESIKGKRLVVVDDSIVRGTTTKAMVRMLRDAGALEVHLRISSPPFRWPCFYGIDTPNRDELLAASRSVDDIALFLGADSVAYLDLQNLMLAIGAPAGNFCNACLTGNYPTDLPAAALEAISSTPGGSHQLDLAGAIRGG